MDSLYYFGAKSIERLQRIYLPPDVFLLASRVSDPAVVHLIVFPLAFFLHPIIGSATLLSIAFSEWLNCGLKWVIYGERPFWWVKTHSNINVSLKQFSITCETGPGSPSGHCMVFIAGWLPLILYITHKHNKIGTLLYFLLIASTVMVAISRLYIAAHFPHQVIEGSMAGALIGRVFYQWAMRYISESSTSTTRSQVLQPSALISPIRLITIGIVSFLLGMAIGAMLTFLGVEVDRSFRLAEAHCHRREWVHPSTSIESSYARVAGSILGLAIAFTFRPLTSRHLKSSHGSFKRNFLFQIIIFSVASSCCRRLVCLLVPLFQHFFRYWQMPLTSVAREHERG